MVRKMILISVPHATPHKEVKRNEIGLPPKRPLISAIGFPNMQLECCIRRYQIAYWLLVKQIEEFSMVIDENQEKRRLERTCRK